MDDLTTLARLFGADPSKLAADLARNPRTGTRPAPQAPQEPIFDDDSRDNDAGVLLAMLG